MGLGPSPTAVERGANGGVDRGDGGHLQPSPDDVHRGTLPAEGLIDASEQTPEHEEVTRPDAMVPETASSTTLTASC